MYLKNLWLYNFLKNKIPWECIVVGWLVFILLFLDHSSCLDMSILRHLHTRIREGILLSSHLSRAIGQSPYQSRVLAVTSRCVYRPSVVQLFVWVFVCV